MTELLTAAQMRAIEAAAMASGELTGLELMERAGRGVVEAVFAEWPELAAGSFRAVVLCGPGNNGGDGFVVARLLKEWGWAVRVLATAPAALPSDAAETARRWREIGPVERLTEAALRQGPANDLYVDAIFGTGLSRAPEGDMEDLLRHLAGAGGDYGFFHPRLVAVDAPSGLCLDSGRMLGGGAPNPEESRVPLVALTVTFDSPKLGHFLNDGPECCGKLVVADIGIGRFRTSEAGRSYHDKSGADLGKDRRRVSWAKLIPGLSAVGDGRFADEDLSRNLAKRDGHKFGYGHALILSGGAGHGGAARMAARGALRIGAGLVTLGCGAEAIPEHAARLDAVMLRQVGGAADLGKALADDRINALCLGPGLGLDRRAAGLVRVALGGVGVKPRPMVLDADALTLLSRDAGLFKRLHGRCVLTPHGGEFARLFPDIAAKLEAPAVTGLAYSKVDATREAAARAGCVVLFKGADTVIAAPDGRCSINAAVYDRAAPWLATAGSGDVLAGFICGLLARGFAPMQAAETAAWLHVECARSFGPGLIAEDLPEELPKVFRGLGV